MRNSTKLLLGLLPGLRLGGGGGLDPDAPDDAILLESGGGILTEDGEYLILEDDETGDNDG